MVEDDVPSDGTTVGFAEMLRAPVAWKVTEVLCGIEFDVPVMVTW